MLRSCVRPGTEACRLLRATFLSYPARREKTPTGQPLAKGHASFVGVAQQPARDCPDGNPLPGNGVVKPPDGRSSCSPARVSPRSALAIACFVGHTKFSTLRFHQLYRIDRLPASPVVARPLPGMQFRWCCFVGRDESGMDKVNLVADHPVVTRAGPSGSGHGV